MTLRKIIFWTHLVVGLVAGVFILSMCATGAILSFEPQIVAFAERGVRSVPLPSATDSMADAMRRLDIETLLRRLPSPPSDELSALTIESNPTAAAIVRFKRQGSLYVNPYTGAVLGQESKAHQWLHSVEEWHRWLGARDIGKPITGATAIAFLALSLSGLYLWWPFRSFVYRADLKGKARDWNWHTVTGFWCSLYLVLVTSTGIIMSYTWASNLLYTATGMKAPIERRASPPNPSPNGRGESAERRRGEAFLGLNAAWVKAEQQVPSWTTIFLRIPSKPNAPFTFFYFGFHVRPCQGTFAVSHRSVHWRHFEMGTLQRS